MNTVRQLSMAFLLAILLISSEAMAWNSFMGSSHKKLTRDAIAKLDKKEYPDLHRFAGHLKSGSNNEGSHNPPSAISIPGERWSPDPTEWWNYDKNPRVKTALPSYKKYDFKECYLKIGYECHLSQDIYVPAHLYSNIHGRFTPRGKTTDGLENYADNNHKYKNTKTPWTFVDKKGRKWNFWLSDKMDDDNYDDEPELDLTAADDNGHSLETWRRDPYKIDIANWGTYGYGSKNDRLPGSNKGKDVYAKYAKKRNTTYKNIAFEQLLKARDRTIVVLKERAKQLPPLLPDDDKHGRPSVSATIFGPNSPVTLSFEAYENRKKTVRVEVTASSSAIRAGGKTWDASDKATHDLDADPSGSSLPWKGTWRQAWNGAISAGLINDGKHQLKFRVKDKDGNWSNERTRQVKYDKTKPTAEITVTVQPSG